jgi:hypothetical protein
MLQQVLCCSLLHIHAASSRKRLPVCWVCLTSLLPLLLPLLLLLLLLLLQEYFTRILKKLKQVGATADRTNFYV